MGGIFISYRREDSAGHAGRLFDRLARRFGQDAVFMDVSDIEPGTDFVQSIERALAGCDVMVLAIGREWLCAAGGRRRLDDPDDLVRVEVGTALRRGVVVIPALLRGAAMPRAEDLPDELKPLARRQAVELSDTRWDSDVAHLEEVVARRLGGVSLAPSAGTPTAGLVTRVPPPRGGRRRWAAAVGLMVALGLGLGVWMRSREERPPSVAPAGDVRPADGGGWAVALPEMATVHVSGQRYELLGIRRERYDTERDMLAILVRLTNTRRHADNLWDNSFRLLVGDRADAPLPGLDAIAAERAATDGEVRFTIPHAVDDVRLQITNGGESTAIPLALARSRAIASDDSTDAFGRPRRPSLVSTAPRLPRDLAAGARVIAGDVTYEVLAVQLDPYDVERVQLRFTIRCTSGGASAANFWSATFRLVLDGVPRAPDGYLNEVVAAGTSKEATVSFLIDEHPERVALRIDAARPTDVPVDLGAPR